MREEYPTDEDVVLFDEVIIPIAKQLSAGYECMKAKQADVVEWEKYCILQAGPFIRVSHGNEVKILQMLS